MTDSTKKVRALIVDDSTLIRQLFAMLLAQDPEIEVVGSAPDPYVARDMIKSLKPDVITLDVEMPRMDGLSFLRKIMALHPMPVVMVSTLTQANADVTIQALEAGAVDFVAKPTTQLDKSMDLLGRELSAKVKNAARTRVYARPETAPEPKPAVPVKSIGLTDKIIFVGASTGGVEALLKLLLGFPADCPPILITQHMERFTASFAARLNTVCAMEVIEATHDQPVQQGHVYIAPGSHHLEIARKANRFVCQLHQQAAVSGHRPSVDVLFGSAARVVGRKAVGAILTGMGKDGAQGLYEMRQAGAATLGQDEKTSLIYGMPRAAFEKGAVGRQVPLDKMATAILAACTDGTGSPDAADARKGVSR
jgi:two-component system, chemotaxis family, protein-glutamate methylesterase/glutaminase